MESTRTFDDLLFEVFLFYCGEKDGILESYDNLKKKFCNFVKLVKVKDIMIQQEERLKLD